MIVARRRLGLDWIYRARAMNSNKVVVELSHGEPNPTRLSVPDRGSERVAIFNGPGQGGLDGFTVTVFLLCCLDPPSLNSGPLALCDQDDIRVIESSFVCYHLQPALAKNILCIERNRGNLNDAVH
jgi:hypothetical protein